MKINWIELSDYRRMSLSNIKYFKITPTERIQLVLGTNGSGKSSLMGELSPLPAVPSNYGKQGSKTISITHMGHEYTLASHFHPSQKHSFVKNGEELNPGGTVTVQKDLVKSEFGYRQDIHDLMVGTEKFSLMSPSRRRQWFTELCETNYDYAIGVYNRIAERSRDTSGALKLAKKRLVVETAKIISAEEIENINQQIVSLLREIDLLYNSRTDEGREVRDIESDQARLQNEIVAAADRIRNLKQSLFKDTVAEPDVLRQRIEDTKHELTRIAAQVDIHTKTHGELREKYEVYLKTGAVGLDDLRAKNTEHLRRQEQLQEAKRFKLDISEPSTAKRALESVYDTLEHLLNQLPANEDKHFSSAKLQEAKEKDFVIKENIRKAEKLLEQYQHQKLHMEQMRDGGQTECPKCKHRWVPGYSEHNLNAVVEQITSGSAFLSKNLDEQKALQKVIDENTSYGDLLREYTRCTRSVPMLQPLWNLLSEQIHISPMYCLKIIDQFKLDLDLDIECAQIEQEIIKTNHLIELAIKTNNEDMGQLGEKLTTLEETLGDLAQKTRQLNEQLYRLQLTLQRVTELNDLGQCIEVYTKQLSQGVTELVKATRNEIINQCLQQLQIELAQKQNALNEINVQKGIIADIESSIERLTAEEETLKILVASLSPHDGLIAEGLLGFIRSFVRKMNILIRKIWTYRLEVQDCNVDSDSGNSELDYKFPMLVGDCEFPVPDISKGSAGMREIIDLSFKIIAMQYLDISSYPLFADELGHAMDVEHKAATINLIKYLMEHCAFSQLWMISHDFSQYMALSNTEICVLCESNIVVPKEYNAHVVMA